MDIATQTFKELGESINACNEFFQKNHKDTNFDELEAMLKDVKKLVVRSTVSNAFGFIDRVVENGEKGLDGMKRQFNVSSIQVSPNDELFLVTHEVIGFDKKDKKYVLDSETTLVNLKDVTCVY